MTKVFTYLPGRQPPIELAGYRAEFRDTYPCWEMQTKRWFVENASADWTVFDVGASVGCHSILLARLCDRGIIHAFETSGTTELLEKNIAHNKLRNVIVHPIAPAALSRGDGSNVRGPQFQSAAAPLIELPPSEAPPTETGLLEALAPEALVAGSLVLDNAVHEIGITRLDCIRIAGGASNANFLEGAEKTLSRFNPWLVLQFDAAPPAPVLEWLFARGYHDALVLDDGNYALRSSPAQSPPAGLSLHFETRPIFIETRFQRDELADGSFDQTPQLHGDSMVTGDLAAPGGLQLVIAGPRWSYGMSFVKNASRPLEGPLAVEIDMQVATGGVGIGFLESDYSTYAAAESTIDSSDGRQTVNIMIEDASRVCAIMFRKADGAEAPTSATIFDVRSFSGAMIGSQSDVAVLRPGLSSISGAEIKRAAGVPASADDKSAGISVVPSGQLGSRLGYGNEFRPPFKLYRRPLRSFTMEIDDAPILRFLFRNSMPKRHLEFGTWQGFGTTLCADSCDAEIWTLNLPEGERGEAGELKYATTIDNLPPQLAPRAMDSSSAMNLQSDSGEMIGWMYRAAGHASRVHQILVDSREWDASGFEAGFFDSILIDGGHTADVVISDTEKALPLLRQGGIMLWHDFCPDHATINALPACKGVVSAIGEMIQTWRPFFDDIFWIQPSFLLIGIKGLTTTPSARAELGRRSKRWNYRALWSRKP